MDVNGGDSRALAASGAIADVQMGDVQPVNRASGGAGDAAGTSAEGSDCDESVGSVEEPAAKLVGRDMPAVAGVKRVHDGGAEQERPVRKRLTTSRSDAVEGESVTGDSSAEEVVADSADSADDADMDAEASPDLEVFRLSLAAGQQVDVFCARTKQWLAARIDAVDDETCTVHFMGWNKSQDEVFERHRWSRIAPRGSEAAEQWEEHDALIAKRKEERLAKLEAAQSVPALATAASLDATVEEAPFVEVGLTRSGRKVTKRLTNDGNPKTLSKPTTKKRQSDPEVPDNAFRGVPEDDLCGICGEIEDEELSEVLLCDGGCLKSYHFSCLGIDAAPEGEKWLCEQCRNNEQKCFACARNGTINAKGGVFRCSVQSCGRFYHQSCVDDNSLSRRLRKPKSVKEEDGTEHELFEYDAPFKCPRHICSVCENPKKGSDLMCCLKCPESYHPYCVPPSARYNTVGLLCSKHPEDPLPAIPSFYVDPVTVDLNLHLPMLFLPKNEPVAEDCEDHHHFRLLLDIVESVKQQPPTYRTLHRNLYTFKPNKESLEDVPMCVCKVRCGDDCINRLSFTECFGPALVPGAKIDKNTKESNCHLGENCGNRALHQKVYPHFKQFHTIDKGWALRLQEPVTAGQLVIEYVGEVINEEEKERRLQHHAQYTPDDKNMYIMELGKGEYIDARFKGSVSRFINHSCDPNCHLVKWNVKGINRIAITALHDIAAGEELSYDYQFHTKQAMEWKCHCKSKNCRGTMAPERINQGAPSSPARKLTKKEKMKKLKRALVQEKIQQERESKSAARRLSLTAQVAVGNQSVVNKAVVRIGPAPRELAWVQFRRVFLRRNARRGFDFLRRKEIKDAKIVRSANGSLVRSRKSRDGTTSVPTSRSVSPVRTEEACKGDGGAWR
jgi:hypothetical protein